jgi:hypothetical protein
MRKSTKKWVTVIGAIVISGASLMAGFGSGGAQAAGNPFNEILDKLNQILTAINGMQQSNSTLRWDQNLPAAQRFVILAAFNNDAVLDKNTGLVWEKSPATTANPWGLARSTCLNKNVGGQKGWRLPAIAELTSLINPSVPSSGPALPPGHPFTNVLSLTYWSASTVTDNPANGWTVNFVSSDAVSNLNQKTDTFRLWCVRGGMNADQY